MHYCRLRHWGNQAKIAEIQGIPGAHEEHMCTAVLTHSPIYTQTHSRITQMYVPWDLPQAYMIYAHTYLSIYIGTYALTVHVYWHVLWLALVYFPKCVSLEPVTSLTVWQGQWRPPVFSHNYLHVVFPSFTQQYPRESNAPTFLCLCYILKNPPTWCWGWG